MFGFAARDNLRWDLEPKLILPRYPGYVQQPANGISAKVTISLANGFKSRPAQRATGLWLRPAENFVPVFESGVRGLTIYVRIDIAESARG